MSGAAGATPDRATVRAALRGDLVVFVINGVAFASWMSRVPDVRAILSIGPGQLGVMLLGISAGAILGLPLAGAIARALGARRTVNLGMAFAAVGLVAAALAVGPGRPFPLVMPGLFLYGLGNGVWDVAQNLEGADIERAAGRTVMPWFHAAFSAGTVVGALVGAAATAARVPVVLHIGAVVALMVVLVLRCTPRFLPPAPDAGEPLPAGRSAWIEPRTLLIGVLVLAAAFTEGVANDWLAVAFVDGHGVPPALGVIALATFLTAMTTGRLIGAALLDRYGRVPVLAFSFGTAIAGSGLVVFAPTPVAFAGAALWGLGAALGFPVGMSAAADDPRRAAARLSVVATIGYGAFLAGPPLLGFLGDHVGVLRALLVVSAASLFALAVVPVARPPEAGAPPAPG